MLVLSRKQTQKVIIDTSDGAITVHVVTVRGVNVRLGFDAPKTCRIRRDELEKIDSLAVRNLNKKPIIVSTDTDAARDSPVYCKYCFSSPAVGAESTQCQNRDCPGKRI